MDYRNIYQVFLDRYNEISSSSLDDDFKLISPNGDKTKNTSILLKLIEIVKSDNDINNFEYQSYFRFVNYLNSSNYLNLSEDQFNDLLDKDKYIENAMKLEAMTSYDLIYWSLKMYSLLYRNDAMFKNIDQTFKPIIKKDGIESTNPLLVEFVTEYFNKPNPINNGYVFTHTWLFGINEMTNTLSIRFGQYYWNSLYPYFYLFSPRTDGKIENQVSFLAPKLAYKTGKEIKNLLPLYVAFGHSITFNYDNHLYQIKFPFSGMGYDDIQLTIDGKDSKTFDFLDDFFKAKIFSDKEILDVFDECNNVTIEMK